MKKRSKKYRKKLLTLAAALFLLICGYFGIEILPANSSTAKPSSVSLSELTNSSQLMRLDIIDVGQGSGALLQVFDNGNTRNILIDAGEKTASKAVCSHLKSANAEKLDLVIITHPHTDHFGGILQVLNEYEVDELWLPFVPQELIPTNSTFMAFLALLEQKNCNTVIKSQPELLTLSDSVTLELLDAFLDDPDDLNNTSLCLRIDADEASFLITGDAEVKQEDKMRKGKENVDTDIFVAGHHGSNSSNKQHFLNSVTPIASVISVGKDNSYNLPSAKAVERLSEFGNIYRTDINGTVSFFTDGKTITVIADNISDTIDAKG